MYSLIEISLYPVCINESVLNTNREYLIKFICNHIGPECDSQEILKKAFQLAKTKYNIDQCTLQVEIYSEVMDVCRGCKSEADTETAQKKKGILKILTC